MKQDDGGRVTGGNAVVQFTNLMTATKEDLSVLPGEPVQISVRAGGQILFGQGRQSKQRIARSLGKIPLISGFRTLSQVQIPRQTIGPQVRVVLRVVDTIPQSMISALLRQNCRLGVTEGRPKSGSPCQSLIEDSRKLGGNGIIDRSARRNDGRYVCVQ